MAWFRTTAMCACVLALAACSKQADAPEAQAATRDTAPTTAPAIAESVPVADAGLGEFQVVSILVGTQMAADKVVAADTRVFKASDVIHASVLSTGAHQGLRMSVRWLGPGGVLINESTLPVVPAANAATTFTLSNAAAWPAGQYAFEASVNGRALPRKTFEVRATPEPR